MSYPIYTSHNELFEAIDDELRRARAKFPSSRGAFAALVEEVGELADEMISAAVPEIATTDEPPLSPDARRQRIRSEAIQVAVMAIRITTESDSDLDCTLAQFAADLGRRAKRRLAKRYPETKKPSGPTQEASPDA